MTDEMPSVLGNSTSVMPPRPMPYLEKYWLICESILVILTFITVYISVCLLMHALGKKTARRNQNFCQKIWLKWLCVSGSVTLFLRLCSDQVAAFYGWQSDEACFITVTVSTVLFTVSLYSIYAFLWVRQSIFYANAIIRESIPAWITYLSWFTVAFMALTGVTLGVLYNIPQVTHWEYRATYDGSGCLEVSADESAEVVSYVGAAGTVFFQVILLGLFVYPLLSREMERFRAPIQSPRAGPDTHQSSSLSNSGEQKQQKDDDDEVFETTPPTGNTPDRSPGGRPISPLALSFPVQMTRGRTPHVSAETDTGAESGADMSRAESDRLWAKNTTIKRDTLPSSSVEKVPRRKTVVERLKLVRPGSVFYRKARDNSISSENTASPVASDTEGRPRRTDTLRKVLRKENKKGQKLVAMMKHYAILTIICIGTDILAALIQISATLPELVYLVIYDINLIINLLCIVVTFTEWRSILMPFLPSEEGGNRTKSARKLTRKPTPLRRRKTRDRVQELRKEGKWTRRGSNGRLSSGSGYESGDSAHSHIYRPANEALIKTKR